MQPLTVEQFKQAEKTPVIVVLDNVRSLHNVGATFRTADAFRLEAVYLCGITATPPNKEIHKTALGATETVSWLHFSDTRQAIEHLRQQNYQIWAVEQAEGSVLLNDFQADPLAKHALIFGNEVHGVQPEVIAACDGCVEVPQWGTKHSLNVSVCVGIVVWAVVQRLGFPLQ